MKFLILVTIFIFTLSYDPISINNPYKENKNVAHSLFREKDDRLNRLSGYPQGVPQPIEE